MKEQKKPPEKELNEMEASKQLDTEFKTMVIRLLKDLNNESFKGLSENSKDLSENFKT